MFHSPSAASPSPKTPRVGCLGFRHGLEGGIERDNPFRHVPKYVDYISRRSNEICHAAMQLRALSEDKKLRKELVRLRGVPQAICALINLDDSRVTFQRCREEGYATLLNLLLEDPETDAVFGRDPYLLEALFALLQSNDEVDLFLPLQVIDLLATNVENQYCLCSYVGMLESIMRIMNESHNEEIRTCCLGIIVQLTRTKRNRFIVARVADLLNLLVVVSVVGDPNEISLSVECLRNLSQLPSNARLLADEPLCLPRILELAQDTDFYHLRDLCWDLIRAMETCPRSPSGNKGNATGRSVEFADVEDTGGDEDVATARRMQPAPAGSLERLAYHEDGEEEAFGEEGGSANVPRLEIATVSQSSQAPKMPTAALSQEDIAYTQRTTMDTARVENFTSERHVQLLNDFMNIKKRVQATTSRDLLPTVRTPHHPGPLQPGVTSQEITDSMGGSGAQANGANNSLFGEEDRVVVDLPAETSAGATVRRVNSLLKRRKQATESQNIEMPQPAAPARDLAESVRNNKKPVATLEDLAKQYGTPEDDTSSSSSPSDPDVDPTELHEPRHRRKQRRPRRPFVKPSVEDRAVMETFVLSSDEEDTFDLNEYEGVVRAFEEAEEHRRTQENRDTQRQEEEVTDQDDDDGEEEEEEEEVEEEEEEEEEYENSGGVNYENVVIPPLPLRERPRVPGSAVGQVMSPQPRMVDSFQDLTSQQESLLQFYRSLNTELYLHQREQESRPSRSGPSATMYQQLASAADQAAATQLADMEETPQPLLQQQTMNLQPQNEEEKELIQQIVQTEREFLRLFKKKQEHMRTVTTPVLSLLAQLEGDEGLDLVNPNYRQELEEQQQRAEKQHQELLAKLAEQREREKSQRSSQRWFERTKPQSRGPLSNQPAKLPEKHCPSPSVRRSYTTARRPTFLERSTEGGEEELSWASPRMDRKKSVTISTSNGVSDHNPSAEQDPVLDSPSGSRLGNRRMSAAALGAFSLSGSGVELASPKSGASSSPRRWTHSPSTQTAAAST